MCGEQTPSVAPRIGARVDFFSPSPQGHLPLGNLLFLNPTSPSSCHATHVRFQHANHPALDEPILVSIHTTGDLTEPLGDAGVMKQFTLRHTPYNITQGVDMPLGAALSLNVGNNGIIGRRVSMRRGEEVLADGIVGFNFAPAVSAP
ncbi:hypothetical protein N657DRAFT_650467 [Parathielavia appendiculata]|uniref:Uncharacterized protein n=1 Tax=Parathielavia appendiculata TaxID=2587402 RepID=A0AAN6YYS6_9PEZI|nr:hypothetical protein N657DRAFT_650467 [Parathielavia appendiculata]